MKFEPIVKSLLETDLYKFSMGQAIFHNASKYKTTWSFKCRNKDVKFTLEMVQEIKEQIKAFCSLRFTEDELNYLKSISWLDESYVDYLHNFAPNSKHIFIGMDSECGLSVETKGTWLETSMYEIPILAIVNEVYFRSQDNFEELLKESKRRTDKKFESLVDGKYYLSAFSEFGLRRRLCAEAQEYVVKKFIYLNKTPSKSSFVGTSNVYLAKKYSEFGVRPVGTMAHEWIMCMGQGTFGVDPLTSNDYALKVWVKEYGKKNGIALTDTLGTKLFNLDFSDALASVFDGVRHDSGDPIKWGEMEIEHFKSLGIDPLTKTLLFSDSLDFERADKIANHFKNKAKVAFGIGTFLSNDTCMKPLNIVMKVTECNGKDVAKISDSEGKGMCKNPEYVDWLKKGIGLRLMYSEKD